jgi:cytochrome c oxidase cbb3-type subunit 3
MQTWKTALGLLVVLAFLAGCSGGAPETPLDGLALFKKHCASCHGPDGKGKVAKMDMTSSVWQKSITAEKIAETIKNGVEAKGMPAFKTLLNDNEVDMIVKDAVRKFAKGG